MPLHRRFPAYSLLARGADALGNHRCSAKPWAFRVGRGTQRRARWRRRGRRCLPLNPSLANTLGNCRCPAVALPIRIHSGRLRQRFRDLHLLIAAAADTLHRGGHTIEQGRRLLRRLWRRRRRLGLCRGAALDRRAPCHIARLCSRIREGRAHGCRRRDWRSRCWRGRCSRCAASGLTLRPRRANARLDLRGNAPVGAAGLCRGCTLHRRGRLGLRSCTALGRAARSLDFGKALRRRTHRAQGWVHSPLHRCLACCHFRRLLEGRGQFIQRHLVRRGLGCRSGLAHPWQRQRSRWRPCGSRFAAIAPPDPLDLCMALHHMLAEAIHQRMGCALHAQRQRQHPLRARHSCARQGCARRDRARSSGSCIGRANFRLPPAAHPRRQRSLGPPHNVRH